MSAKRNVKSPPGPKAHAANAQTAAIAETLKQRTDAARDAFEHGGAPQVFLHARSDAMDDVLVQLWQQALEAKKVSPEEAAQMVCVAVGGYGRRELFPYSDIDLMVWYEGGAKAKAEAAASHVLYALWDLKLRVGHSVLARKELADYAAADHRNATTMLDARYVCGSAELFGACQTVLEQKVFSDNVLQFVEAKLAERDARHRKWGDSRFVLEPNVKDGKGGLRDLHTLYWLAKYAYRTPSVKDLVALGRLSEAEYETFANAQAFLWSVRLHLHCLAERAEERLTFDVQLRLAERMNPPPHNTATQSAAERFMKTYFDVVRSVGSLTRIFCALLEEEKKRKPTIELARLLKRQESMTGLVVEGERINFPSEEAVVADPALMLELFAQAQRQEMDIHPRALQIVTHQLGLIDDTLRASPRAGELFLEILLSPKAPEVTLRRMNEVGVLARYIPEFAAAVGQMQYDRYHVFTVDEHTLVALANLHAIERGQFAGSFRALSEAVKQIQARRALYVAMFCHDIAKGQGGQQSGAGEGIVRGIAQRLGLDASEVDMAAWLVQHHLLMTDIIFKRNLEDPETIEQFVAAVQSPERLRLLLVITVADIAAVAPHIWNGWKATLLGTLYYRALERMGAATAPIAEVADMAEQLREALDSWPERAVDAYMEAAPAHFWPSFALEEHRRIAVLHRKFHDTGQAVMVDWQVRSDQGFTRLWVVAHDTPELFSHVAGILTSIGAMIVNARLFQFKDTSALAVLDFHDAAGQAYDRSAKLETVAKLLAQVAAEPAKLKALLAAQTSQYGRGAAPFSVPTKVFIDNQASQQFSVLEVNGRDRVGFLFDVMRVLAAMRIQVAHAYIHTYGDRVVDVFYIKDLFGMKIAHENKKQQLIAALEDALGEATATKERA